MSEAARAHRRQGADAGIGRPPVADPKGDQDQIVRLFAEGRTDTAAAAPPDDDWSASLAVVRGVATKVREMHRSARDAVREAERATREAEAATRAAEDRARQAEAAARDALARAEWAEERAWAAEERADAADASAAEARAWLRRLHECMLTEFGTLPDAEAVPAQVRPHPAG